MTEFLNLILSNKTLKAWVGGVSAAGAALGTAAADGVINGTEVGVAVGAFLLALGLVYRVPNGKASE